MQKQCEIAKAFQMLGLADEASRAKYRFGEPSVEGEPKHPFMYRFIISKDQTEAITPGTGNAKLEPTPRRD
jgi:hypothetical protein